jgi:hypothetical protein
MAKFTVVPYEMEHGDEIIEFGMNDKLMELDASYTNNRLDMAIPGLSFTLFLDKTPIVSGGIVPMWEGVAEGWVLSSKHIFDYKIKAASIIKKRLDYLCINNKIIRLQTAVKEEFLTGVRFAQWLGLEKEGLMKFYGLDQTNYWRMAKYYERIR